MSDKLRGSEKLRVTCETMASLTAEDINQVAGGADSLYATWWIRGTPAFWSAVIGKTNPAGQVLDSGGFNARFGG
jgi:hypothetical protein